MEEIEEELEGGAIEERGAPGGGDLDRGQVVGRFVSRSPNKVK